MVNEDNSEIKEGDLVCVNWTNADGMCGDGIYGFGKVVSIDSCRGQVTVNMRDQNFPSYYKDYTVPFHSVLKDE